jgi:hypothetical protein
VLKVVGEEKAKEVLQKLADGLTEPEVDYVRQLWGKEFQNLEELTYCFDIIHKMMGYEWRWTMEDEFKGYEKIFHCPIHSATPKEFQGKGICKIYCNPIGEAVYARLNAEISRDKYLPDGDPYCGCRIEWKRRRS